MRTDVRLSRAESKLLARVAEAGEAGLEAPLDSDAARALLRRGLVAARVGRLCSTAEGRARAAREAGGETGFLAQHRTVERRTLETERGYEALLVDLDESPLGWLARRKDRDEKPLLAPAEVAAGERLRADFTLGQMTPRITANWEAAIASGRRGGAFGEDPTDATVAARIRVSRALDAVGPELAGALLDVCCFLKGLEEVERERRWPARGAKLVLGLALARLARHYGFAAEGQGPAGGRVLSWGAPDSRPRIDGGPS
ncbi:hypothetical protein EK403_12170 [Hansschlegelia zhihuaiae]|uniref:DUF6456 domain-containing protein n=2 Tax=Hansschlegelia zhihuaiae TaxID=405005 RepID=A0A4Q0MHQ3_9HYPH|nr:hypothetical protein EK403_12170 [Hansschlegelia zhihuaiae]